MSSTQQTRSSVGTRSSADVANIEDSNLFDTVCPLHPRRFLFTARRFDRSAPVIVESKRHARKTTFGGGRLTRR